MTMEDAMIRPTVADDAVERFAAYVGALRHAASWTPSSSSSSSCFSAPISCDLLIGQIHVKFRWLIRMLAWVRATLDDAEDMDITEESVHHWLRQLQDAADAAEDVLDEFSHKALRLAFVGDEADAPSASPPEASPPPTRSGETTLEMVAVRGQVRCSRSPTSLLEQVSAFLRDVEKRIEEIASRFVEIEKPEQALKHEHSKEQMDVERIYAIRTTSSVMKEPAHIVGRQKELAKIKQFLLTSDAEEESRDMDIDDDHVSVMAIVGMGGLGKTTLAQLAYNDPQVNQHFQLKAWVCVSEDFDVIRLTKAMLQSLNVEASGLSELDPLHKKLVKELEGKHRFLLVLDDVWEAENLNPSSWNLLTAPLRYVSADTKIIMTTRSKKVSEMVATNSTYDLGFLSDEDTLELFKQHAFEGRDPNLCQNLVDIGKEIARKCGGVPLAAKTLGGLLCTKDGEEWNRILDSKVWNAIINKEDSIIPILRLSYLHLSAPLKRCFRYCSLFPKDHVFYRDEMIRMWMAQGYIKATRRKLMEDIGQRYIDNLMSRSFFQKHPWFLDAFQMHDLMHDLASCVSGDECYSMDQGDKSCSMIPSRVRHLSVSPTRVSHGTVNMWLRNNLSDPKSLRSFILLDDHWRSFFGDHELPSYLYTGMEHLRVMDLGRVLHPCLPMSIARLKHLRFLRISVSFEALPESVGSMCHLQTLDLGLVSELPNSISNLHNLRHLILNSGHCVRYPVGMGKLTDLQTVSGFYVSPKYSCSGKLGELKDMNNIRGEFAIQGLENLSDVNEAKKACLHKKRNISSLCLEWNHRAPSSSIDGDVLESLKPSVKLASLEISGFKGPSYPSWLGDGSFTRLVSIRLEHCQNCTFLPPLGQLTSLKSVYISEARAVEYIGSDFFSGGFPQLEELTLKDMYSWKSWCGAQKGECPKLKKFSIEGCDNLQFLSLINLGAVEDIYISISSTSKLLCMPGNSLELSHLQSAKIIKIESTFHALHIEAHLSPAAPSEDEPQLQFANVGQREAEYMLGMCSHICGLTVKSCSNLTSLRLGNYSALKYVEISDCPQLRITSVFPQLWQVPSLQRIHVHGIDGAEMIQVVRESYMKLTNVYQPVASVLLKDFSHMIRQLTVKNCPNLTSLPLGNYSALECVEISDCPRLQITSVFPQLWQLPSLQRIDVNWIHGAASIKVVRESYMKLTNVYQPVASVLLKDFSHMIRQLTVKNCPNLTSLPLGNYSALECVEISDCPRLQITSVFPQLWQLPSLQRIDVNWIHGAASIKVVRESYMKLTNVYQPVASVLLKDFSHMIRQLTVKNCPNLTSLPLGNYSALECVEISDCPRLQITSVFPQLWQLPSLQRIDVNWIHGAASIKVVRESYMKLTNVYQPVASVLLKDFSHMIRQLTVKNCPNLTSLPLGNYSALECVEISDCPRLQITSVFPQLWQLPSLQRIDVNWIHGAASIKVVRESYMKLTNVYQPVASVLLKDFSHMIRQLTVKNCPNLTSLPLGNYSALECVEISDCPRLQITSVFPQLWQLPSLQRIDVNWIHGAASIKVVRESYVEMINVDQLVASVLPREVPHMIHQLVTTNCANLTSLPWTDLTTLEYLRISECPLFQVLDAQQLPSTVLQVLCIYGNKQGGERNVYLVFRNVHDASAASEFCSVDFTEIHTLDVEWDCCCTNDRSNVGDAITQEVLLNLDSLCISSKRLVIRGYIGSGFDGCYADFSSKTLRIDVFHSRLSHVSLLQCSKCDLAPLSRLPFLEELEVEGETSLESVALDCLFPYDQMSTEWERQATHTSIAFPRLQKLQFRDMPVWKEWLGTKECDFPFLWKLILNQCPKLRALPHLPPGLKELILQGCEELRSLSSSSDQGLKSLKSLWLLSVTNCPNLDFTTTQGPPPRLELLSLTGCPLLVAWCEGHPRMLAGLSYLLVDGVRVSTENFTSLD